MSAQCWWNNFELLIWMFRFVKSADLIFIWSRSRMAHAIMSSTFPVEDCMADFEGIQIIMEIRSLNYRTKNHSLAIHFREKFSKWVDTRDSNPPRNFWPHHKGSKPNLWMLCFLSVVLESVSIHETCEKFNSFGLSNPLWSWSWTQLLRQWRI